MGVSNAVQGGHPKLSILPPTQHHAPGSTPQHWTCLAAREVIYPFDCEPAQGWFSTTSSRFFYPLMLAAGGSWSAPE